MGTGRSLSSAKSKEPVRPSKARRLLLSLRWHSQPENRNLSRPSHIQPARVLGIRQIKCLAMFAAIDLSISSPSLLHVAASLFQHIGRIEPVLEMPAAELAFLVLLIASPLSRLLDFHLVVSELRRSLRARGYGCSQKVHPRSSGPCRGIQQLHSTRSLLPAATACAYSLLLQRNHTTVKRNEGIYLSPARKGYS